MHIATVKALAERMLPARHRLRMAMDAKAEAWRTIVKIGRTLLQDATPLTLGKEFSSYVAQLDANRAAIDVAAGDVRLLAQVDTAVRTGLNAPDGFGGAMATGLSRLTGHNFAPAPNPFEALASNDALVRLSGALGALAVSLTKIANDFRWLASGPARASVN